MRHVRISGADTPPIGAPPDWNEEEHGHCSALFVRREHADGISYMRSAWEVDDGESLLLYAGARLTLAVAGNLHPVVQLGIEGLPDDFEPFVTARQWTHETGRPCVKVEMLFSNKGAAKRVFSNVEIVAGLPDAVAIGIANCQALARKKGWVDDQTNGD